MAKSWHGSRKKKRRDLTLAGIYDMAFAELGLTEKEFFSLPPFRTYMMQMRYNREIERRWEQTRMLASMQHNTAQGRKRNITPQQIIRLPFDNKSGVPEWNREEALELIAKWPDIKN